jgi:signal recognition particle subunit SRP54
MFESLSDRFDGIFKNLRGKGRLSEADVDEVLREIRLALLEADVNFTVVRNLVARIRERAVGADLTPRSTRPSRSSTSSTRSSSPPSAARPSRSPTPSKPPTVVLMAGLQGSGKTTNSAKLARWFKAQGRNPMLVGADLQRPAAVEQLRTLGASGRRARLLRETTSSLPARATRWPSPRRASPRPAPRRDVVIVDTAGRLAIDAEMMEQVRQISAGHQPDYTFLVIDAMTGQDAVTVAENFHQTLALDGVILTKLDGDARGGAALSVKEVVGKPIAFAHRREARRLRPVPPRPPRRPHPGHGRHAHPHRQGQGGLRRAAGRGAANRCSRASSRSRTSSSRWPRSRRWATSATS